MSMHYGRQGDYYTSMVMSAPYRGDAPSAVCKGHQSSQHSSGSNSCASGYTPNPVPTAAARQRAGVYTHNPYGTAACSTVAAAPAHPRATAYGCPPVYASESHGYGDAALLASNVVEQFMAVIGDIANTACSPRGRHLLSSVLSLQHVDKVEMIYNEVVPQINMVVLDVHGCGVARLLIEYITTEQLDTMVPYLEDKTILELAVRTQHTRRLLQTIFERHRSEGLTPIVEVLASDCLRLACTQQGCIAIMRVIENSLPEQKHMLLHKLLPCLPVLTMDPYGNYVAQCILQNTDRTSDIRRVSEAYRGHWVPLCCQKYASNVMEKIVWELDAEGRQSILQELVFDTKNLKRLLLDSFGNFVLQAIIASSTDAEEYTHVYKEVTDHLHLSPYGNKIDSKLSSKYRELMHKPEPYKYVPGKERTH
ncbi:pumilio/PUF RNA binding protein 5 [Strigomonas culicis]|uniref:Pumilio/PUF RNA binding protein 5 n=1 Tax=Strigomonas culicis TaxID=28005 RepID=S9UDE2_9TRYP|nr:pumilio/PUF RNA binding protein 5 [Strigomonas culicis]EPY36140.1 pumilio/PUF RNA binding protein 5 [Strigomonas culicis]|eukprot:EPY28847.1 pumilio/PUF RNA binding protein 5 [Strigomonas culicis]